MSLCIDCAKKLSTTGRIPDHPRGYKLVGWQGVCTECSKQTTVYGRQDLGINPRLMNDQVKL